METIEYRGFEIKIYPDDMAEDPRVEWGSVGKMVCCHSRYNLGDEHQRNRADYDQYFADLLGGQVPNYNDQFIDKGLDWILDTLENRYGFLILPLYLYDHSGLTINTSGFSCPWDSGQLGHIYATKEQIQYEWNGDREAARRYLLGEVEIYDHYLTGAVYGYNIEPINPANAIECDDSCWGFYGYDHRASGLLEMAQDAVDCAIDHWKTETLAMVKARQADRAVTMENKLMACAV